MNAEFRSKE